MVPFPRKALVKLKVPKPMMWWLQRVMIVKSNQGVSFCHVPKENKKLWDKVFLDIVHITHLPIPVWSRNVKKMFTLLRGICCLLPGNISLYFLCWSKFSLHQFISSLTTTKTALGYLKSIVKTYQSLPIKLMWT